MDDLISRQAAIDAIGTKSDEIFKTKQKGATFPHADFFSGMAYAANIVQNMPSKQPEVIRCKECKHWRSSDHTCHEHSLVSPMMANDFCSRAERRTDDER